MSKPYINTDSIDKILANDEYVASAQRMLDNIFNYTDFIMRESSLIKAATTEAQDTHDYQNRITQLDRTRKTKHDSAISSLSSLNKIADRLDIQPVYNGEIDYEESRGEIARCIIKWCKENIEKDKYGSLS